jgi:hypothetical protein
LEDLLPKANENIPLFDDDAPQPMERRGFSFGEMVRCDECLRANPPTRVNCLYCGRTLTLSAAAGPLARPSVRPLEKWEQGYNNILLGLPARLDNEVMVQLAGLLRLEADDTRRILSVSKPMPIARTGSRDEAALVERMLKDLGLATIIVSDIDLKLDSSPTRLRALKLDETGLTGYQLAGSEATHRAWSEVARVITGRLIVKQVESKERKSKRGENEILEASETASDEAVVDIYTGPDDLGWRITANGFDFSCLGNVKSLLASDNFSKLVQAICERAPRAEYDNSYDEVRRALTPVWALEQETQSRGMRRDWKGKYHGGQVMTTSNESQFTRYSRLCHYLKAHAWHTP